VFIPVVRAPGTIGHSRAISQFRSVDASTRTPAEIGDELQPLLAGATWAAVAPEAFS